MKQINLNRSQSHKSSLLSSGKVTAAWNNIPFSGSKSQAKFFHLSTYLHDSFAKKV